MADQVLVDQVLADQDSGAASLFLTAPDGLKLHVRAYGPRGASALPVVCLPGLARTAVDFETLAEALAKDGRRRVYALDYRGRGLSDYDRDPMNYTLVTELGDTLAVLTALSAMPAVFVGTSRGGLLTMLMAVARPTAIAGAVLNDIGPVIEPKGLARIKSYVGKLPQPTSYEEGAEILRRLFDQQFPKLTAEDWLAYSRRTYKQDAKGLAPAYDVRLAKTLEGIEFDKPLPPLWKEFDALAAIPLMVIRGSNSDILSEDSVAAMRERHPAMTALTVPDQGHAPLLAEPDTIRRIAAFVDECEARRR
jgi:pimeloyl-ACP methyl ester carboxylesterase